MSNSLTIREKLLEREYQLDQLGPLIVQLTECAEQVADAIEAETLSDEQDPDKLSKVAETNEACGLLDSAIDEVNDWIQELIEPWEETQ